MTALPEIQTIDGIDCRYRPPDGGPLAVMLHGIGSNLTSFDRLWTLLPPGSGCLAWNAPGYGTSRPLSNPAPVATDYADALAGVLDRLTDSPVLLIGHSLGTLMATAFAATRPNRVQALILLACAQGYGHPKGTLDAKSVARLADLDRLGAAEFAAARAPRLLHEPDTKPDLTAQAIAAMAAIDPSGYGQAVHMLATGDLAASAAQVRCPSLVLVGAEDRITPPVQSRRVHAALTRAAPDLTHDYREIPGCGHLVHQEDPGTVAQRIADFTTPLTKEGGRAA